MKTIPLTRGKVALVDDEDYERLNQYKWCADKDVYCWYARRAVWINGKCKGIRMHREILGLNDSNIQVDHKDRDGLNNQKYNLRICESKENSRNRRKRKDATTSSYKGVTLDKNKWQARITVNGKTKYLGFFFYEIDAAKAYDEAAKQYHGEFAYRNFI